MSSRAVQEAVALLQARRDEAAHEMDALAQEVADISAALVSLGVNESRIPVVATATIEPNSVPMPRQGRRGTIRSAVQQLFEQTPDVLSLDEVVERLRSEYQEDRTDDQFRSTVRTSLWTLRNAKLVVPTGRGRHVGMKWLSEDASAAASAGAEEAEKNSATLGEGPSPEGQEERHVSGELPGRGPLALAALADDSSSEGAAIGSN